MEGDVTMFKSRGNLPTDGASRYALRLCKHWSHKFPVTQTDGTNRIDFGGSSCELQAHADHLSILLTASQGELHDLEAVVVEHLQRFAPKEEQLQVAWSRSVRAANDASEEQVQR